MSRVVVTLVFLLALAGCDLTKQLPQPQDGGLVTVPGSYHSARMTPGHKAHLLLTGDKQVECHDCHAIADAGFKSPGCRDPSRYAASRASVEVKVLREK